VYFDYEGTRVDYDYYGFIANGVAFEAPSYETLCEHLQAFAVSLPDVRQRAAAYEYQPAPDEPPTATARAVLEIQKLLGMKASTHARTGELLDCTTEFRK